VDLVVALALVDDQGGVDLRQPGVGLELDVEDRPDDLHHLAVLVFPVAGAVRGSGAHDARHLTTP
jgi:hypothetical protein